MTLTGWMFAYVINKVGQVLDEESSKYNTFKQDMKVLNTFMA